MRPLHPCSGRFFRSWTVVAGYQSIGLEALELNLPSPDN